MLIKKTRVIKKIEFGLIILPIIILALYAFYIPFVMSMYYSLTEWNGISRKATFIGLKNFKEIFLGDTGFNSASIFTAKYAVLYIVIINILALLFAIILDKKLKTTNFLRAGLFMPYILSTVIVGFIWRFIFMQGFDSLNKLTGLSLFQLSWLGDEKLAFISVILVSVWQSVGFYVVIYIAGLQSISTDLIEASVVDGAGPARKFFSVILPMLMPSVTICVFLSLTNSIKIFDVIISLTAGGPGGTTTSVAYDIYKEAFQNNMYGYGSAKSLILFIVILVITMVQVWFFKSKEVEM